MRTPLSLCVGVEGKPPIYGLEPPQLTLRLRLMRLEVKWAKRHVNYDEKKYEKIWYTIFFVQGFLKTCNLF